MIVASRIPLLSLSLTLCVLSANTWAQPNQAPAIVVVDVVQEREVAAGQTLVGAVVASRTSTVGSAVDGRVVELYVNDGDAVGLAEEDGRQRGQPIAQLLTETISIEIAAAQAEMDLRKQELRELEAGSRPEEKDQAQARLEASKAVNEFAQSRLGRVKSLFEQARTASKEEYEEALSAALAAKQNELANQAASELVMKGPRQEQIEQARARLAMASEQAKKLEDQKAKYTVRAPFEGYVVAKHTEVGAWLSQGDSVAEIVALDPIEVDVMVPEIYISHVRLGATVRVTVDALTDQVFTGQVARIIPQADLRSRAFPVKIRLENPKTPDGHLLKAGMLARVTLTVGPLQQALLVPKDALVLGGATPVVIVVVTDAASKQSTVRPVPVQLGVADGSLIQVLGDVAAGQRVVVVGNERVRPGQPVQPVPVEEFRRKTPAG